MLSFLSFSLSLSFSTGGEGQRRREGESHHHPLVLSLQKYPEEHAKHNDSGLLSLFADRDLQESAAGWP